MDLGQGVRQEPEQNAEAGDQGKTDGGWSQQGRWDGTHTLPCRAGEIGGGWSAAQRTSTRQRQH